MSEKDPISYSVEGIPETLSGFREFSSRAANDETPAHESAQAVANAAGSIAPVVTGALASSYAAIQRYVVNEMPYAHIIEYGSIYVEPQFVVRRSFDMSAEQVEEIYSRWLQQQAEAVGFERG